MPINRLRATAPASVLLAVIATVALTGCMTGTAVDPDSNGQELPGESGVTEVDVDAAWLDGGRMIGVVTQGSSSCAPLAQDVALEADGTLAVVLDDTQGDQACTRDMAPRVTLVTLPDGVDPQRDLTVVVTGEGYVGDTDLDGVPGLDPAVGVDEYAPSAGWTDEDGEFIILTWGSSSCPDVIESSEVTGEDAVTVTFATAPADQVCTMDMGPRALLAFADGLDDDANAALTLVSGDGAETTLRILGENWVDIPVG